MLKAWVWCGVTGATHATWFSAEVEMIRAINFLPFHGGSLYLSEMARDGEALVDDIERLNGDRLTCGKADQSIYGDGEP